MSFRDDSGTTRSLVIDLQQTGSPSTWPVGTHTVRASVGLSNVNVLVTGTVDITSATDPFSSRDAGPQGRIEGNVSLAGEGCTVVSGTFATPYCASVCTID